MNLTLIILISLLGLACLALGGLTTFLIIRVFGRKAEVRTMTSSITERIRAVGKLTGLEVISKEIVTQTKGLNWLPPLLLSQARLAMIFHFEKQYYVDLGQLEPDAVQRSGPNRFIIVLPAIQGNLNLLEVIPYDIQSGKLLGLLDVFKMDAEAQGEMMKRAQVEASRLYEENAAKYEHEARRAISRQVNGLLELFDVTVEVRFSDDPTPTDTPRHTATRQLPIPAKELHVETESALKSEPHHTPRSSMLPTTNPAAESRQDAHSPTPPPHRKNSFWSSFGRKRNAAAT